MTKMKLSYDQNAGAAIVFLNMFDLTVEGKENICLGDSLKIMKENNEEVGTISFDEHMSHITTQTELGLLTASYSLESASDFKDIVNKENTFINYSILRNDSEKITGSFLITCVTDDKFNFKCFARPSLNYWVNDSLAMTLVFQSNGNLLDLIFIEKDTTENIKVAPFGTDYIKHAIIKGLYDKEKESFPYRKLSCISNKSETERDQLKALTIIEEYGKTTEYHFNCYDKNQREILIQVGLLMKSIDPDMYKRIQDVKELLKTENISLFDSFVRVSLENYTDEEIDALLGIKRTFIENLGSVKNVPQLYLGIK